MLCKNKLTVWQCHCPVDGFKQAFWDGQFVLFQCLYEIGNVFIADLYLIRLWLEGTARNHGEVNECQDVLTRLLYYTYIWGSEKLDESLEVDSQLIIDLLGQRWLRFGLLQIRCLVQDFIHNLQEVIRTPLLVIAHHVGCHDAIDLFDNWHLTKLR